MRTSKQVTSVRDADSSGADGDDVRVYVEWCNGEIGSHRKKPTPAGQRRFGWRAHYFVDCTDAPAPTIQTTQVIMAIERGRPIMKKKANGKPPYRVPLMREIKKIPLTGLNVVSTFSGCGGSSLGYRMAGFKTLWANEFVAPARDVYQLNFPDVTIDPRDIREVRAEEILDAVGLAVGEIDLLDGSPPCASFSTAGKREEHWGEEKTYSDRKRQRNDDLFFEFVRLLDGLKPRAFVAENVKGLTVGKAKGHFIEIIKAFKACGYRVRAQVLDAQWLGVPQVRQRVFFVGAREDLERDPTFPSPLTHRYSLRDALPELGKVTHGNYSPSRKKRGEKLDKNKPSPTVVAGVHCGGPHQFVVEDDAWLNDYAVGREWDKLRPGQASTKFFQLKRAHIDHPVQTITAGGTPPHAARASVTHPLERRKFTIEELKAICAFPPDFQLSGTYAQQWERLGRAVPPLMMKAIAERVRDDVLS